MNRLNFWMHASNVTGIADNAGDGTVGLSGECNTVGFVNAYLAVTVILVCS